MDESERLIKAAAFLPDKDKHPPLMRIETMLVDLAHTLQSFNPDVIVIEVPSSHVNKKRHKGGGAGLAIYGLAVGHIRRECLAFVAGTDKQLIDVDSQDWTQGTTKYHRQGIVACQFPQYIPSEDPGGDVADAIALGVWYLTMRKVAMIRGAG